MKQPDQTLLPLSSLIRPELSQFVGQSNNALINQLIDLVAGRVASNAFYVFSQSGEGKSFLLKACCHEADKVKRPYVYQQADEFMGTELCLDDLPDNVLYCLDDVDQLKGDADAQQKLLQLYEFLLPRQGHLLVSASMPIAALPIELEDLKSRLSIGGILRIISLNDAEKQQVVQEQARARGFELEAAVVKYMFTHYSRDLVDLMRLLNRIDNASLAQKRRITVPFLKQFLHSE